MTKKIKIKKKTKQLKHKIKPYCFLYHKQYIPTLIFQN